MLSSQKFVKSIPREFLLVAAFHALFNPSSWSSIQRPIRPMITEGWTHDTQVLSWVLSYDGKHQPSPLAVCGASAALLLSDIPLTKPVAAVEVGMDRATGAYIVNPTKDEQADSPLIMTLAGTADGVLMIEGAADFLTEV